MFEGMGDPTGTRKKHEIVMLIQPVTTVQLRPPAGLLPRGEILLA